MTAVVFSAAAGAEPLPSGLPDIVPGPIPAEVIRVIDGDTIEVRARIWVDQDVVVSVRLDGVDAPETYRPRCEAERAAGEAAADRVAALAEGRLSLTEVRWGKYAGRVVARVGVVGVDVTERLLAEGLGVPYGDDPPWCAGS